MRMSDRAAKMQVFASLRMTIWMKWLAWGVVGETEAGELPACGGREEVSVGGADVRGGSDAGASAEDHLRAHELAVVLAEGAGERRVAGVAGVGAGGPLPGVAEDLLEAGGGARGCGVEVVGLEEVEREGGRLWRFRRTTEILRFAQNDVLMMRCLVDLGGRVFPLELGGKAMTGEASVGVGFEEA